MERKRTSEEKSIEKKLVKAVKSLGGLCLKFVSPGYDGVPDRLILIAYGKIAFVEVKAPGEKPRPLQVHVIEKIKRLGFNVFVLDSEDKIGGIIDAIQST